MLQNLYIENVAVIEKASIDFDAGFQVLTGETGAGKSIVIDAISAVLGERVSRDLVRAGSEQAHITALFAHLPGGVVTALEELGYEPEEDGTLLVTRTVAADGKGSCRIGGRPATVSMLRTIGRLLVNIHGQHDNQALLAPERHVDYLDRLGGLLGQREAYAAVYRRLLAIESELRDLDMDESMKARRIDLLRFQIDEIEAAQPQPGEEEALRARRDLYRHAEKVADALLLARAAMSGDEETEGVVGALSRASSAVTDAARYMEAAQPLAERMENAACELDECAAELRGLAESLEFDPQELEETEARLDTLRRLTSKYGPAIEDVLAYQEQAQHELDGIESADARMAQLQAERHRIAEEAAAAAAALTTARCAAAGRFADQVRGELTFLDMPSVSFEVAVEPAALSSTGGDQVEFRLSANPGEPPKPLARIASGGELSRIMLAIKSVMAEADDIDTLVYDEIDAGISGRAAWKVGVKLRQTAAALDDGRPRQVLCVTHLAQIAAQAHSHFLIEKTVRGGRTFTDVRPLTREGRLVELARIIGGEDSPVNRQAAEEMLAKAEQS